MAHRRLTARPQQLSPSQQHSLGLPRSTALIVGSIVGVGVGIISLPYSLASHGPISMLAMAPAAVGASALALIAGITAATPDAFPGLAQLEWRRSDDHRVHPGRLWPDLLVAVLAPIFSPAFTDGSRHCGEPWYVIWGPLPMAGAAGLVGVPVYLAEGARMSAPAEL